MSSRLNFQSQFFFAVLLALFIGWLISNQQLGMFQTKNNQENIQEETKPFTTLQGVLKVRLQIFTEKPPQIIEVKQLEQGRLTISQKGDSEVIILDKLGEELYKIQFSSKFLITGNSAYIEHVEKILILPKIDEAHSLSIITPNGEIQYVLQTSE